jgi:hypothetical protein
MALITVKEAREIEVIANKEFENMFNTTVKEAAEEGLWNISLRLRKHQLALLQDKTEFHIEVMKIEKGIHYCEISWAEFETTED